MHRSPAEPNPADTAASAARSRSASGSAGSSRARVPPGLERLGGARHRVVHIGLCGERDPLGHLPGGGVEHLAGALRDRDVELALDPVPDQFRHRRSSCSASEVVSVRICNACAASASVSVIGGARRQDVPVQPALAYQHSALLRQFHHPRGRRGSGCASARLDELDADHQALAPHVTDKRALLCVAPQALQQEGAALGGVALQVMVEQVGQGRRGADGGDRVAAEGGDRVRR